jgi:hypothetical protein
MQGVLINPPITKVVIVDLNMQSSGDWAHGVWLLQQKRTPNDAHTCFIGIMQDAVHCKLAQANMEQVLMVDWWPTHSEAGPEEPSQSADQLIEKPVLSLCSWNGGTPGLPPYVLKKFQEGDSCFDQWKDLCVMFTKKVAAFAADMGSGDHGMPDGLQLTSPDFSVPPTVTRVDNVLEVSTTPSSSFAHDSVCPPRSLLAPCLGRQVGDIACTMVVTLPKLPFLARLFTCRSTRTLPALCITKDWSLYAYLEDMDSMDISCSELLGFNVGDFVTENRNVQGPSFLWGAPLSHNCELPHPLFCPLAFC